MNDYNSQKINKSKSIELLADLILTKKRFFLGQISHNLFYLISQ